MILQREIIQAINGLKMHILRSCLSTLGVIFGVIAIITILSICEGSKRELLEQIEQLGIKNIIIRQNELSEESQMEALRKKSAGLQVSDMHQLKANLRDVDKISCLSVIKAEVTGFTADISSEILAVSPDFFEIQTVRLSEGRFLCSLDGTNRNQVCLLGADISRKLGRLGHTGQSICIGGTPFKIVGVLEGKKKILSKNKSMSTRDLNQCIFVVHGAQGSLPRKTASQTHDTPLTEIILRVKSKNEVSFVSKAVQRIMEIAHHHVEDYQLIIPKELLEQSARTQNLMNLVLIMITGLSMMTGGIGIMNIMLASVSERTHEIGIRRAIGATRLHIMKQFLMETLILSCIGALVGIISGVALSYLIGFIAGWYVIITYWSMILSLATSIVVGLFSGLYPAYQASKMDPISALRHY